ALAHPGRTRLLDVEADAPRADESAAEAASADRSREVQPIAAQPPAEGSGRQESDIACQRAEVARVIRQPLELERDAAEDLGSRGWDFAGESLERLGVGERMTDARVARERLCVVEATARVAVDERPF